MSLQETLKLQPSSLREEISPRGLFAADEVGRRSRTRLVNTDWTSTHISLIPVEETWAWS